MRILCVDDDPVARVIYKRGLGGALPDDEITEADSGEAAIAKLADSQYDMVITDLSMPGKSGIDVLAAARAGEFNTEVIMVTGKASVGSAVEAMRGGARDYIEKPIDIPLLCEKIENIREYQARMAEAEDLRAAKDVYEEQASHEVRMLEIRVSKIESRIGEALKVLENGRTPEQVDAAIEILKTAA